MRAAGFEPAAFWSVARRSIQLSYARTKAGDENRTHLASLEGWCSTNELHPQKMRSAQNRNRTSDTWIFSPLLYHLSYLGLYNTEMPETGIEPVRIVRSAGF